MTGSMLLDGISAGLNLVPRCVVMPDVPSVPDLQSLLASLSNADARILALDAPVCAHYHCDTDAVTVEGQGNVLLAAFKRNGIEAPTARLQVLSHGKTGAWPT